MYNKQYPDFSISRTAFCLLLDNEPKLNHIKIRTPRTDMCDFCEFQKRKIAGTKSHDELKADELTAELFAHQKSRISLYVVVFYFTLIFNKIAPITAPF